MVTAGNDCRSVVKTDPQGVTPHIVPDHHAVRKVPTLAHDPNDGILQGEASYYGKKFLRMAGIVQMLHAVYTPYDKYLNHAHGTRKRSVQSRDQIGSASTASSQVLGCHATVLAMPHHKEHSGLLTCPIWPILINLLIVKFRP